MLKKRGAGVLLHISSMPSDYGVGVFDENVIHFIDKIADMGFTYWQVLPFNPIDGANSPYCSPSAFAGNYIFINPKGLYDMRLICEEDYKSNIYDGTPYTADYEFAGKKRLELLKKAFLNINDELARQIKEFEISNSWLTDYSVFMAVKEEENMKPWWEWSDEHAHYFKCIKDIYSYEKSAAFWKFVQFVFYKQWNEIKAYANKKGVAVIGDMPIYVAMDSVDVWSNLPMFLIDEKTLKVEKVAGVPPDYFSKDGQLWGNPLYDWDYLEATDYEWWFERIKAASKLYDITRIDHFRAFASYYSIPYPAENAINGEWVEGPRIKFFNMMEEALGKIDIVAEDLGTLTPDVTELMEQTGYPGMKVLEFAFDSGEENDYLPHKYTENCVVYTGTHDNDTVMGWLETAKPEDVNYARSYCQMPDDEPFNWGLIRVAYESKADTAIVPMQDILGLGKEARMNIPSTLGGNWVWRLNGAALTDELADKLKTMSEKSGRLED